MDKVMKYQKVMSVLRVCRTTLYYMDRDGILRARRMRGNRLYYLESDVENYIKSMPYHCRPKN